MPGHRVSLGAIAPIVAVIAVSGLLLSSEAEGASCGAKNQRPCTIFERIPSCDAGLVEDFARNLCVARACPARTAGKQSQRP